jgi:hypothetical protein
VILQHVAMIRIIFIDTLLISHRSLLQIRVWLIHVFHEIEK